METTTNDNKQITDQDTQLIRELMNRPNSHHVFSAANIHNFPLTLDNGKQVKIDYHGCNVVVVKVAGRGNSKQYTINK